MMESASTIDRLKRALESEEASPTLTALPPETYQKLARYAQKLRAVSASGAEDVPNRLAKRQLWLIETMTHRLLHLRLTKAELDWGRAEGQSKNILPEERYVLAASRTLERREGRFVKAVVDGQPSFFTLVQRRETQSMTTVRMSKHVGEIIGADLKRYGPFEANDVARLPSGNAQVMIDSKQAVAISGED